MANWQLVVKISDLMTNDDSDDNAILIGQELAKRLRATLPIADDDVLDRLQKNDPEAYGDELYRLAELNDSIIQDIIISFESEIETVEDFNLFLNDLYNWGDDGHRLFVDSFSDVTEADLEKYEKFAKSDKNGQIL